MTAMFGIVEESDAALLREKVQPILPKDVLLCTCISLSKGIGRLLGAMASVFECTACPRLLGDCTADA